MTRSQSARVVVAVLVLAGGLLAGCGMARPPSVPPPLSVPPPADQMVDGRFPVTVLHRFGRTTVPAAPKRIVAVGDIDADTLLALGVVPVAVALPSTAILFSTSTTPWTTSRYPRGRSPQVLPKGPGPFADTAFVTPPPDLIVAVSTYGLGPSDYGYYRGMAPTIGPPPVPETDYVSWEQQTRLVAQAVGRPAEAERLISEQHARTARVAAAHPRLAGRTGICVSLVTGKGAQGVVTGQHGTCPALLTDLGLHGIPELDEKSAPVSTTFASGLTADDIESADPDVVVLADPSVDFRNAARSYLPRGQPVVDLDDDETARLALPSLLSLPGLVDTVSVKLERALRQ